MDRVLLPAWSATVTLVLSLAGMCQFFTLAVTDHLKAVEASQLTRRERQSPAQRGR
jgi:hypothetical protein